MMRNGLPLSEYILPKKIHVGLEVETHPGLVSDYEARDAAKFNLYNWTDWCSISSEERAICVAFFRISNAVEEHVQDAIDRSRPRQGRR